MGEADAFPFAERVGLRRRLARNPLLAFVVGVVVGVLLAVGGTAALAAVVSWSPGGVITYGPHSGRALREARVGQCLNARPDEHGHYETAGCDAPHDVEVSAVVAVPASKGGFPGLRALDFFGAGACELTFTDYVEQDYWRSDLDYRALLPSREAWASGSREVVCLIRAPDGEALTEFTRDSRR